MSEQTRDALSDAIAAHVVLPPDYTVDPDDLDDEKNPTSAWTVGEHLDDATITKLRELTENR
jgi:hypothetical protein